MSRERLLDRDFKKIVKIILDKIYFKTNLRHA